MATLLKIGSTIVNLDMVETIEIDGSTTARRSVRMSINKEIISFTDNDARALTYWLEQNAVDAYKPTKPTQNS